MTKTIRSLAIMTLTACSMFVCNTFSLVVAEDIVLDRLSNETVTDLYVHLAFNQEIEPRHFSYLRKWGEPIHIYTFPRDSVFDKGTEHANSVMNSVYDVVQDISTIIGPGRVLGLDSKAMTDLVTQSPFTSIEDLVGGIAVYVGSRSELSDIANALGAADRIIPETVHRYVDINPVRPLCLGFALPRRDDHSILTIGWVLIEDNESTIVECIYEELMQMFGILNDFPSGAPSLFNDDGVFSRPTELDRLLFAVHFDDRLEAGMTEEEVRVRLVEILTDIR